MRVRLAVPLVLALAPLVARAAAPAWKLVAELTPGHLVTVAAFLDEQRGVTAGCDHHAGTLFFTSDGGKTWSPAKLGGDSPCRFGLEGLPSGAAWTSANGGDNRASADAGRTWTRVGDLGGTIPGHARFFSFADARRGAMASPSELGLTADGGKTWKRPAMPKEADRITGVAVTVEKSATAIRVLDDFGKLWLTRDEGATWTAAASPLQDPVFDGSPGPQVAMRIRPDGEGVLVANLDRDGMPAVQAWHTRDAGGTWTEEPIAGLVPSVVTISADGNLLTSFDMHVIRLYRRTAGK